MGFNALIRVFGQYYFQIESFRASLCIAEVDTNFETCNCILAHVMLYIFIATFLCLRHRLSVDIKSMFSSIL